jgi:hypothetical protein
MSLGGRWIWAMAAVYSRPVSPADSNDEDDLPVEEVERRRELRGVFPGLRITFTAPRPAAFEAVEASSRSFFVRVANPEDYRLGELFDARVEHSGRAAVCRLEVVRKEIVPRSGVAVRLAYIDPANEAALKAILQLQ